MRNFLFLFTLSFIIFSCDSNQSDSSNDSDISASQEEMGQADEKAAELAVAVMEAMGGQENWNNTNFLSWNFFGRRKHYWDKQTGNIRIESPEQELIYLMNVNTMKGKVKKGEAEITNPDSLSNYLSSAKSMWINDSYWLVMPFKLRDPGTKLKYLGEGTTEAGNPAEILELTFENVGDTPDNKYHIMVDKSTNLVSEWSFYSHWSDTDPRFTLPWEDYQTYGNIQLSGNRGKAQLSAIAVYDNLPGKLFIEFEK